jgi:tetratricopeptide (TPR) repeat protein
VDELLNSSYIGHHGRRKPQFAFTPLMISYNRRLPVGRVAGVWEQAYLFGKSAVVRMLVTVLLLTAIIAGLALVRAPGAPDDAIAALDADIARAPLEPLWYVERGRLLTQIYEWDRALADYNRALELDAAYADAYYWRGLLYASAPSGDARPLALADFGRYLALMPGGEYAERAAAYARLLQAALTPAPSAQDPSFSSGG